MKRGKILLILLLVCVIQTPRVCAEDSATSRPSVDGAEIVYKGKRYSIIVTADSSGRLHIASFRELSSAELPLQNQNQSQGWNQNGEAKRINGLAIGVIAAAPALIAAILAWFIVLVPKRRRRPLVEALSLLELDDPSKFDQVERLLQQALIAGLRAADVADARFALAYVRTRMGEHAEAATVLIEAGNDAEMDADTAYLLLYLRVKLKQWDEAENLYKQYAPKLNEMLETKMLLGIALLHRARQFWSRRDIAIAIRYYGQLRKLGILLEHVPAHIDQHEVVLGMMLLFDRKFEDAATHFEGAIAAAGQEKKPVYPGQVGVLLCRWRRGERAGIDAELGELVKSARKALPDPSRNAKSGSAKVRCTQCQSTFTVDRMSLHRTLNCAECKRVFIAREISGDETTAKAELLLDDDAILLRDLCMLHCMSLLASWAELSSKSVLTTEDRKELSRRLEQVRRIDPSFADAPLVDGLIQYYFDHEDEDRRKTAIEMLELSIFLGANAPELLNLVSREKRAMELESQTMQILLSMLRQYLQNSDVPEELRRKLLQQLQRYPAFRQQCKETAIVSDGDTAPSIQQIRDRVALAAMRLPRLINAMRNQVDDELRQAIDSMTHEITERSSVVTEGVKKLQEKEEEMMATVSEALLLEEETTEEGAAVQPGENDGKE
jgi:hypothetical protein